MSGTQTDALTAARFSITIDGSEIATFSELTGITTSVDVVDFIESSDKEVVMRKLPGKRNPPTVVLKRGKNNSMELWAWHEAVLQGNMAAARRSCSLVMYNVDGKPVALYHLEDAWPAKIEIGGQKAGARELLMESVTHTCTHIQRVAP
jgi:phage tail-like protein